MKRCRYRIRSLAEADLDGHAYAIAQDNLEAGLRFYDQARETCEALCEMPFMGVAYHTPRADLAGVRYIPVRGCPYYLLFYRFNGQSIDIIRVLHDRMDREGWL